jgi:ribosomal protein S11
MDMPLGAAPAVMPQTAMPPTATGFGANVLNNALATQTPAQPAAQPAGLTFLTDRGRQAGYGKGSSGFVAFDPNAQYRMWDERGKNRIVSSGTGQSGLEAIHALANQFNTEQGRKANYGIERLNPATGRWERILENDPRKNVAGKIADIALPVAASFIPGIGPVLGAALGSAASSVAQGRSLENTLMRAGLSAATAGTMKLTGADKAISGALGSVFAPAASEAAKTAAQKAAEAGLGEIVVSGTRSALPSVISSAVGGLGSQLAGMAPGRGVDYADRVFDQPTTPAASTPLDTVSGDPINVFTNRTPTAFGAAPAGVSGALAAMAPGLGANYADQVFNQPDTVEGDPIVVTDTKAPSTIASNTAAAIAKGVLPSGGLIPSGQQPVQQTDASTDTRGTSLDEIVKYLRAAGLLTGVVGGALGGGGGQGAGVMPNFGNGSLPSTFGGRLPAPTMPGAASNFAPRPANFDWKRYGYGPGQSFFDYVPQAQPNTSNAYTGYAQGGEVEGGAPMVADSFAVRGPGSGRDDAIPALVSDGEYIIDAETVALLGDGSSEAGADRLDKFRVNVRKHKGQQLAKGGFSPDAKPPEHYLYGGRT